jgi:hypothetical protein
MGIDSTRFDLGETVHPRLSGGAELSPPTGLSVEDQIRLWLKRSTAPKGAEQATGVANDAHQRVSDVVKL